MHAHFKRAAYLGGATDMAFQKNRDFHACKHSGQHVPIDGVSPRCFGGVAVQRGGDNVRAGGFGGLGFGERGDVGAYGPAEFGMNACKEGGPGLVRTEPAVRAIERNDVGPGLAHGVCGGKIRGDVDVPRGVPQLHKAKNREGGKGAKRSHTLRAFRAQPACAPKQNGGGNSAQRVEIVERIAGRGLAGDDELAFQGGQNIAATSMLPVLCRAR